MSLHARMLGAQRMHARLELKWKTNDREFVWDQKRSCPKITRGWLGWYVGDVRFDTEDSALDFTQKHAYADKNYGCLEAAHLWTESCYTASLVMTVFDMDRLLVSNEIKSMNQKFDQIKQGFVDLGIEVKVVRE